MSILSVESLTHSFGPSPALRDINLAIRSGEVVGIVGENGAGKSTLLNVLSGTLKPSRGTVAIGGTPVALKIITRPISAGSGGSFRIPR